MFILLLLATFATSLVTCLIVVTFFKTPIAAILNRIIADEISAAWLKYLKFAIVVVGLSGGVRIYELERYITPLMGKDNKVLQLTSDRWVLEIYRTIIGSLQSIAWMLFVFFVFALIAYVFVRGFEMKNKTKINKPS